MAETNDRCEELPGSHEKVVTHNRDLSRAPGILIAIAVRLVSDGSREEMPDDHDCRLRPSIDRGSSGVLP